ncbi:hypothetical protein JW964_20185 [candidate division KSB1 bacterium]|nr:hypothetical protein [candidate division KSB1 bacterium]
MKLSSKSILLSGMILLLWQFQLYSKIDMKKQSLELLVRFCDSIIWEQITTENDSNYGAIREPLSINLCPVSGEAIYPLAVVYESTGKKKYGLAALRLMNWVIRNQNQDGTWSPQAELFWEPTAQQILALGLSYPKLKEILPIKARRVFLQAILKGGNALSATAKTTFSAHPTSLLAQTAAALAVTYEALQIEQIAESHLLPLKSAIMEIMPHILMRINKDGFIVERISASKKVTGIDVAMNLESTIPNLKLAAKIFPEAGWEPILRKVLASHLYFILPDGSIDNSWGMYANFRSANGYFNTPGCQRTFSMFSDFDSRFETAAVRNFNNLQQSIQNDLVAFGLIHKNISLASPKLFPTIKKAINLAMTFEFGTSAIEENRLLPLDIVGWYKYFPHTGIVLIRTKSYMATIASMTYLNSAMSEQNESNFHRPGGGIMTNVWSEEVGVLQTSTPTKYERNTTYFPKTSFSPLPLSSRIEYYQNGIYFTNLYEFTPQIEIKNENQALVQVVSTGILKNQNQAKGNVAYQLTHSFHDDYYEKEFSLHYLDDNCQINLIEPFILSGDTKISQLTPKSIAIKNPRAVWKISLLNSEKIDIQSGKDQRRYQWPVSGLKAFPVMVEIPAKRKGTKFSIKYRIEKLPPSNLQLADFSLE